MPKVPHRSSPALCAAGAFLAGTLYVTIAGIRLDAFPGYALVMGSLASGAIFGLPVLMVQSLAARDARRKPGSSLLREDHDSLQRAFVRTLVLIAVLQCTAFVWLRRLATEEVLLDADPHWWIWLPLAVLATGVLAVLAVDRLRWRPRVGAASLAAVALVGLIAADFALGVSVRHAEEGSTGTAPGRPVPKLVVLGLDGLGSDIFDRYRDSMPNLSAFARTAARGKLRPAPPMLSDAIWTSLAVGLPSSQHGVTNYEFFADDPHYRTISIDRFYTDPTVGLILLPIAIAWHRGSLSVLPSTRFHRRGVPFWEETKVGRVGLICWLGTWPAEKLDGVNITDRWPPEHTEILFHHRSDLPEQVWPPQLMETLAPMRRSPLSDPDPALLALAPMEPEEVKGMQAASRGEPGASPRSQPFVNPYFAWINGESCLAAAHWVEDNEHPDLLALYLQGIDHVEHAFLPRPDGSLPGFDEKDSARLGVLLPNYLHALDERIGWLLALDDGTTTLVFADHSMAPQETGMFANWHSGDGIVLARGPGYQPGQDLGEHPPEEFRPMLMKPFQ